MEHIEPRKIEASTEHWAVWRIDDNGNTFILCSHLGRAEAERMVEDFTARGHKQTYWIEKEATDERPSYELVIGSEEVISTENFVRYTLLINDALMSAGIGSLTVTSLLSGEPNEWGLRSTINVKVSDIEAGVRILRRLLRTTDIPDATWIWQFVPDFATYEIWGFSEQDPPTWGW